MRLNRKAQDHIMKKNQNIILIGMAGAGKSTLGVLLAKALGMDFIDSDIIIQQRENRLLQEIIDADGINTFLRTEEEIVSALDYQNTIIATGGSVVYSDKAMTSLKENAVTIYLSLPYEEIQKRVTNIETRGIVLKKGNSLKDAFDERLPLYEKYADIILECQGKDIEACVTQLVKAVNETE